MVGSVFFIAYGLANFTAYMLTKLEKVSVSVANATGSGGFCALFGCRAALAGGIVITLVLMGTFMGHFYFDFTMTAAFYWSMVTLTTVGYGDYVPTTPGQRVAGGLFVLFGTTTFALCITQLMAILIASIKRNAVVEYMTPPLTSDTLNAMDAEGTGVISKEQYVRFMLIRGGFVPWRVLHDLERSFERLDEDGNGVLSDKDIIKHDETSSAVANQHDDITRAFGHIRHQTIT